MTSSRPRSSRCPAGARGSDSGLDPVDLVGSAWFIAPDGLLAADGRDPRSPERLAAHRAALVEAVRRLVAR